jgi:hypothetical protein
MTSMPRNAEHQLNERTSDPEPLADFYRLEGCADA